MNDPIARQNEINLLARAAIVWRRFRESKDERVWRQRMYLERCWGEE